MLHATRVQTHVQIVLKTIVLVCAAAGLAAAAAVAAVRQASTYLSVSVATSPASSVQSAGAKDVPMLGLRLRAGEKPIIVRSLTLALLSDKDGDFKNGIANDVDVATAFEFCSLQDVPGHRVSGPVKPSVDSRTLTFAMNLEIAARKEVNARVVCTLGIETRGGSGADQLAFAVNGLPDVQVSSKGVMLPISATTFGLTTRTLNEKGTVSVWRNRPTVLVPSTAAPVVVPVPAAKAPVPTPLPTAQQGKDSAAKGGQVLVLPTKSRPVFSRAKGSPSGYASADMAEVLRFTVAAEGTAPLNISKLTFRLSSVDLSGTGWNSCKNLASSAKWGLRNAEDLNTRLEDAGDWTFYQADGTPCGGRGTTVSYAVVDFTRAGDPQPKAVGKGRSVTYALRVDASGASRGDTLRVDLPAESESAAFAKPMQLFAWTDTFISKPLSGAGIKGLPVVGEILKF